VADFDINPAGPLFEKDRGGEVKITDAMIWAGLEAYYSFDRKWDDPAEVVRSIFAAMHNRELEERCSQNDPASPLLGSPFRSPIGASVGQKQ
jgi:hypothetical protein